MGKKKTGGTLQWRPSDPSLQSWFVFEKALVMDLPKLDRLACASAKSAKSVECRCGAQRGGGG